ncbi:MAG: winged helix-turn-helix domain-containing protein [Bosea sp.]|uniref:winged helix-turn-helix domain-containing protein n=1 Tax=unclassified Bosea (in: a-proteobacteria) TaxID=2653178 RepID=UPI00095DAB6B|nr:MULTISPECIES: helix-turn-helix domain-containing protein [unclassified Bosea (in: a-proteobacteria)]MBN9457375.1 winged helix-turn-helix domain-containing protein [Bosea sp. (in: a-proteobacteria)]OJV09639.1 MAG: hypothetical protein BGO20_02945 [Bosea sp. 67-29]
MTPTERRLREEIDQLREESRWLRELLRPPEFLPAVFRFTALEERAFKALLNRDQWPRESLHNVTYDEHNDRDLPDIKVIDVMICKMRKKLKPLGVEIETLYGQGYRISSEHKQRVRDVIAAEYAKEMAAADAIRAKGIPVAGESERQGWVEVAEDISRPRQIVSARPQSTQHRPAGTVSDRRISRRTALADASAKPQGYPA